MRRLALSVHHFRGTPTVSFYSWPRGPGHAEATCAPNAHTRDTKSRPDRFRVPGLDTPPRTCLDYVAVHTGVRCCSSGSSPGSAGARGTRGRDADQMSSLLATGTSRSVAFRGFAQASTRSMALPGGCVHLGLPSARLGRGQRSPLGAPLNTDTAGLTDDGQSSKLLSEAELRVKIENVGPAQLYREPTACRLTSVRRRAAVTSDCGLTASAPVQCTGEGKARAALTAELACPQAQQMQHRNQIPARAWSLTKRTSMRGPVVLAPVTSVHPRRGPWSRSGGAVANDRRRRLSRTRAARAPIAHYSRERKGVDT
jgi:hypothetical protein